MNHVYVNIYKEKTVVFVCGHAILESDTLGLISNKIAKAFGQKEIKVVDYSQGKPRYYTWEVS